MIPRRYRGLIALNALLVGALVIVALAPSAGAQGGVVRPRGEYTMVSGKFQGSVEDAIYIVDSSNQELIALRWDRSKKSMAGLGYRSLAADSASSRTGGGGR
jgi:hypothetical protein